MASDAFRQQVATRVQDMLGEPIPNSSADHAAVLIEHLFGSADRRMDIVADTLPAQIFATPDVLEKAEAFLAKPGGRLRLLVEDADAISAHPLFGPAAARGAIDVRVAPPSVCSRIAFHFAVSDGTSYRFQHDRTLHAAVGAFGDMDGAANLENIFQSLWDASAAADDTIH